MPTYEYLCKTCSHRFETWQKMTDDPLTVCPECGHQIRRVLYPAGIVFKGSGFYKTDHPAGAVAQESHESKAASTETGSTSESKSAESGSGNSGSSNGSGGTSAPATTSGSDSAGSKAPANVA